MNPEIASVYDPHKVEKRIYQFWEEQGYFHAVVNKEKNPFSLVIPPPNVTGILHMGHVLDNTLQDIIVRSKRMQGYETTWAPGTDHAGIATQNVVEKKLAAEGTSRQALGRDQFVERIWQWKEEHGNTIIQQLKRLGCSCDWARLRFTMDEDYSQAVTEVFCRLYKKGLIYRGNYIINWCPRCQTALSDEEVEHREIEGALYWIRYPLKEPKNKRTKEQKNLSAKAQAGQFFSSSVSQSFSYIVVATTRPETMLGDTAVAVHPDDKRYKEIIGQTVLLPILNREIPIISDPYANPEFASGAVKVTPAHDPNDFEIGQRHQLPEVIAIGPDGQMNENAGPYQGLDRFECRKRIVKDLEKQGLFMKKERHLHSVGHCYRCETMIEPYLSLQWFVRMKPLAKAGIKVVQEGQVRFFPEHWTKVYMNWMENIRDWCISRQLWWGHRIPVWYCLPKADPPRAGQGKGENGCPPIVSRTTPEKCPHCGNTDLVQDPDVLDTWFSSWLWPFGVFGWPKRTPDTEYFYPTTVLNSGKEILFFWVARMIMAGLEFMGQVPFRDVYIHGIARDQLGRKLSKSLGNSPDPLDLIEKFSADALRFGIMNNIPLGGDICLSNEVYSSGRNFCNKLWNAARLVLMNLPDEEPARRFTLAGGTEEQKNKRTKGPVSQSFSSSVPQSLFEDRWILSRLNSTIRDYTHALETYEFSEAAHLIYQFFWHELCDWYLEIIKPRLYQKSNLQFITSNLLYIFNTLLRLLHPYIPFITEELWQKFKTSIQYPGSSLPDEGQTGIQWAESVMIAPWPEPDLTKIDPALEQTMQLLINVVRGVRDIRNKMNIEPRKPLTAIISTSQPEAGLPWADNQSTLTTLKEHLSLIKEIGYLTEVECGSHLPKPEKSATALIGEIEVFIPLEGVINFEKEKQRLATRLKKVEKQLLVVKNKLGNDNFRKYAPAAIIEKETQKHNELTGQFDKLQTGLKELNHLR